MRQALVNVSASSCVIANWLHESDALTYMWSPVLVPAGWAEMMKGAVPLDPFQPLIIDPPSQPYMLLVNPPRSKDLRMRGEFRVLAYWRNAHLLTRKEALHSLEGKTFSLREKHFTLHNTNNKFHNTISP